MGQYSSNPGNMGPSSVPGAPMWAGPNAGIPQRPGVAPAMTTPGPKWPALRIIATLLKVLAWIQLAIGVIVALATAFSSSFLASTFHTSSFNGAGILAGVIELIVAVFAFIWTYATAELIMLFITIEKNTRLR